MRIGTRILLRLTVWAVSRDPNPERICAKCYTFVRSRYTMTGGLVLCSKCNGVPVPAPPLESPLLGDWIQQPSDSLVRQIDERAL